jgi:hypothetical protein
MTPPTRESEVIALLRNRPEGFNALYNADESYLCQGDDVLVAYDSIVAERDEYAKICTEWTHMQLEQNAEMDSLRNRLAACEQTLALMATALPDFKWAAWLLLHAAKQGVNEHRSMMDSQSIITQHIERIEDALDSTITAKKD